MKRLVLMATVALVVAAMMVAMAMPAFAAPKGQVERGPEHARSICSFSGLNDNPDDPGEGQVQSYGQLVRHGHIEPSEVKSGPPSPGFFCNPNNLDLRDFR
jgi:hypothetical protein